MDPLIHVAVNGWAEIVNITRNRNYGVDPSPVLFQTDVCVSPVSFYFSNSKRTQVETLQVWSGVIRFQKVQYRPVKHPPLAAMNTYTTCRPVPSYRVVCNRWRDKASIRISCIVFGVEMELHRFDTLTLRSQV